jgi:predicted methyltransferase
MTKLPGTILDDAKRRPAGLGAGTKPSNRMTLFAVAGLLIGSLALGVSPTHAAMGSSKAIAAAVADPARPADDRARDALRKPAACLEFAGVRPGMTVAELFPGHGYFTRIFSRVVGPTGHVYEVGPPPKDPSKPSAVKAIAADPHYGGNISLLLEPIASFSVPKPVDLVWTSQNYHDLHNVPGLNVADFDRAVYKALKPGGIFLVLDHAAAAGSGFSATSTLHRIDPEAVKKEVTSAGFQWVGESDVLHNSDDAHTAKVFDPSIRGKTDQFIFKFRKPK